MFAMPHQEARENLVTGLKLSSRLQKKSPARMDIRKRMFHSSLSQTMDTGLRLILQVMEISSSVLLEMS